MNYINLTGVPVENKNTFLNEMKFKEKSSLRSLLNKISSLFGVPQSSITLSVCNNQSGEFGRIYCFQIPDKTTKKGEIGRIYLDYLNKIFCIYDIQDYSSPKFMWQQRKLISSTASSMDIIMRSVSPYQELLSTITY